MVINQRGKLLQFSGGSKRGEGGPWVGTPLFWPINAFEWEHIVGNPLYSGLGTPLF